MSFTKSLRKKPDDKPVTVTLYSRVGAVVMSQRFEHLIVTDVALQQAHRMLADYIDAGHEAGLVTVRGRGATVNIYQNVGDLEPTVESVTDRLEVVGE